jgi:hypothetical protein
MLRIVRPRSSYRRLLSLRPLSRSRSQPSLRLLSQNPTHNSTAQLRAIHTGPKEIPTKMSTEPKVDLNTFLGPSLPSCVYSLWFQHVPDEQSLTLPTPEVFKPWFTKDATFDLECA